MKERIKRIVCGATRIAMYGLFIGLPGLVQAQSNNNSLSINELYDMVRTPVGFFVSIVILAMVVAGIFYIAGGAFKMKHHGMMAGFEGLIGGIFILFLAGIVTWLAFRTTGIQIDTIK